MDNSVRNHSHLSLPVVGVAGKEYSGAHSYTMLSLSVPVCKVGITVHSLHKSWGSREVYQNMSKYLCPQTVLTLGKWGQPTLSGAPVLPESRCVRLYSRELCQHLSWFLLFSRSGLWTVQERAACWCTPRALAGPSSPECWWAPQPQGEEW